jgi:tetratricopeptide (TPR) repeat protein
MKLIPILLATFAANTVVANPLADSASYYFDKGKAEKDAKRYLVATQNFEKAIKFNPNNATYFIENGQAYSEMRKLNPAKENFEKAYALEPSNAVAIKELSELYFNYRQWDKAVEFINKCGNCKGKDRIIGMANFNKENFLDAEKYLLKAIENDPTDAMANYTLAKNYLEMEQNRKAVPFFEKATSLDESKANWCYELGLLYYNNGNYRGAAASFENALKRGYTANSDFNENYGFTLLLSGNYEKGEERLLDIYKRKGNKEILRDIAETYYGQKQYQRSLDYCQKLLELDGKDAKALYQAGLTFIKLGKKDKGQGMCDEAIRIDPALQSKKSAVGGSCDGNDGFL